MLSRIWYVVMGVALAIALTATFLHQSAAKRARDYTLLDQLRRDRIEAELWLRIDAQKRADALAPLAATPELRSALRSTLGSKTAADISLRRQAQTQLRKLNAQLKEGRGDLLFALDTRGVVVADIRGDGGKTHPLKNSALYRDARRGFVRDDIWLHKGVVYRLTARPVTDGGRYVGVLVHGSALDNELAKRLSDRLVGADLAFFVGEEVVARHSMRDDEQTTERLLRTVWASQPPAVEDTPKAHFSGTSHGAIATLVSGSAADEKAGYLITRAAEAGTTGLFAGATQEDLSAVQWELIAGIPILLSLLGLLIFFLERGRPMRRMLAGAEALVEGQSDGLPVDGLRGKHRRLADKVNTALKQGIGVSHERMNRTGIDLDEILASNGDSSGDDFFGFGGAPATAKTNGSGLSNGHAKPLSNGSAAGKSNGVLKEPDIPTVDRKRPPPPQAFAEFTDEDEPTMVAEIPDGLLAEVDARVQEEKHFREVFDQFVATQQECGAAVNGLTFDKFARKLRATRDKLRERHNAAGVRFTVYVKDGHAALRATPQHD